VLTRVPFAPDMPPGKTITRTNIALAVQGR